MVLGFTALMVMGVLLGIFLAAFIGANDSANSVGAALGCGISIYKVLFMAVAFEMIGAIFLGGFVSQTITSNILIIPNSGNIDHKTREFMLIMVSVLVGSGVWLTLATIFSLPISTTHSVVGSVVGCGLLMGGTSAIDWRQLMWIGIWWICSPVVGGVVSFILWLFLKKLVMASRNPISRMFTALPILSGITLLVILLFIIYKGLTPFDLHVPIYIALPCAIVLSAFAACFVWKMLIPEIIKTITKDASKQFQTVFREEEEMTAFTAMTTDAVATDDARTEITVDAPDTAAEQSDDEEPSQPATNESQQPSSSTTETTAKTDQPHPIPSIYIVNSEDNMHGSPSDEEMVDHKHKGMPVNQSQDQLIQTETNQSPVEEPETKPSQYGYTDSDVDLTEGYVFNPLVVLTSGCIAMAHGANDISNASAPLSVIASAFATRTLPKPGSSTTVMWVTIVTTLSMIIGLITLGYRVMKTLGTRITKLTPARAFVVQLATSTITLTCSLIGIPLSTTQIVVGCIYGISLVDMKSIRDLQWKLIVGIFVSWMVTIPCAGALSLAVFGLFRMML